MKQHVIIQLTGKVQGVGFRPFVALLANQLALLGYAINTKRGLDIYLFGEQHGIENFEKTLSQSPPQHAVIETYHKKELENPPCPVYKNFEIRQSQGDEKDAPSTRHLTLPADRGLCQSCVDELFDHTNKRFLQPFISCVACGPRASIIEHLPYERSHTCYRHFTQCKHCHHEASYLNPHQVRRFHTQTNACWECGPSLSLFHQGKALTSHVSRRQRYAVYFDRLANAIKAGNIIAVKGIGGFHLICDGRNAEALTKLRQFKNRPDKPFAVMALNTHSFKDLVTMTKGDIAQLNSPSAPIVLMPKHSLSQQTAELLAPNVSDLGCLLPYSAIHYLLFYALLDKPTGSQWLSNKQSPLLAITSANISGEPLISTNQRCVEQLSQIAEYSLCHDRDILFSSDDSVVHASESCDQDPMLIRRARGFAPEPIRLPFKGKAVLAFGAHLKHTFCLSDGEHAFMSPHLGEPDSIESFDHFEHMLNHYLKLFSIQPEVIACDNHPDFFSTHYATEYARKYHLPLLTVPHHQAHIASALAEADLPNNSKFIGLALDGIGLGEAQNKGEQNQHSLWGGELFVGELRSNDHECTRLQLTHHAQLSSIRLPGADKATRQIGRIGFALSRSLTQAQLSNIDHDFALTSSLKALIATNAERFPKTSALGRWFDAVSSLIGLRQSVTYEGQAAMELEALAAQYGALPQSKQLAHINQEGQLDIYPVLSAVLHARCQQEAAAIFHSEIIDGLLRWTLQAAKKVNTRYVVCAGGCFQNRIIRNTLKQAAIKHNLILYYPRQVPTNDAGISLGQAVVASLA